MSVFKITYRSGLVETVSSGDWADVEAVVRSKFGHASYSQLHNEFGVSIEPVVDPMMEEPPEENPPEEETV